MPLFSKKTDFSLKHIDQGHLNITYKGISAVKCPFDYVLYQMLVWDLQPDLIIEIGTHQGGSALYLADLLEDIGKGEIHTIDRPSNEEHPDVKKHPRIKFYKNGFEGYDIGEAAGYSKIMVIEDGTHMYEDSLAALYKFSPLVSIGSYFITEDGIVTELGTSAIFNGGPQRAIDEFLTRNKNFLIDRKWCDFFGPNTTFNVNGYLKRIS